METSALTKMVYARDDQRVAALYSQTRADMAVAEIMKKAETLSQDIRLMYIRFPDDRYAMLDIPRHQEACGVEFSIPGRFSGTRMVAEVTACGVQPEARVLRLYLIDHKKLVATSSRNAVEQGLTR